MGVKSSVPPITTRHDDGRLDYRGIPVERAIRDMRFEHVWALLVDGATGSALPPAEDFPLPVRTGDHRVDMQSALAGLAPVWGFTSLVTTDGETLRSALARASVMALSFLAQSARGPNVPAIPGRVVDQTTGAARRFLMRWQGEVDEKKARAIDASWIALAADCEAACTSVAAETARTGADAAACLSAAVAACSGPLVAGSAAVLVDLLDTDPGSRKAQDFLDHFAFRPSSQFTINSRAEALEYVARSIGLPDLPSVRAHAEVLSRHTHEKFTTDRVVTTLWVAALLRYADVPPRMFTAMIACGKTAGWSATITAEFVRLKENWIS